MSDRVYNPFSAITDEQYLLGQRDKMMDKLLVWPKIKLKGNLLHSLADYCTLIVSSSFFESSDQILSTKVSKKTLRVQVNGLVLIPSMC